MLLTSPYILRVLLPELACLLEQIRYLPINVLFQIKGNKYLKS